MRAGKEKVARLLKTARGQLDGILRMVEDDRYCIDILNQLLATRSILTKVEREIMSSHLESCVRGAFESGGEEKQQVKIDEIITLMEKISR